RKVIRMNDSDQGPVLQVLTRLAEILQGLLVEKLNFAVGAHGGHESGNVVDNLSPGDLARAQSLLPPLAVLDIEIGSMPSGDLPRLVAQRVRANQEPPIDAIITAHACFRVHRSARSHARLPMLYESRAVLRMNGLRPPGTRRPLRGHPRV